MKMFNKKAGIKKLVLLTNMALMSFILPAIANAETLTPILGNGSAYTLTELDAEGYVNDILAYVNQNEGDAEREFNFDSAENVYIVKENLGNTAGTLTVNGVADGENKSTIDVNGKNGFVLTGANTNLVLNNIVVKNANNSAVQSSSYAQGTFNNVEFANNTISAQDAMGGAINNNNYGRLGNITNSTFSNNNVTGTRWVEGGAIWNSNFSSIGNITADFINNSAISNSTESDKSANGGAIYNNWSSSIGNIVGNFEGNSAQGLGANGGAIMNNAGATITSITGDFNRNSATASSTQAQGGAIYNNGTIGDITGDFESNEASGYYVSAFGGAIYNSIQGIINNISGSFANNSVSSSRYYGTDSYIVDGGAIFNDGKISSIDADFSSNYVIAPSDSNARGGAIFNTGIIGDIAGDFVANFIRGTEANGGAIFNSAGATITSISGVFENNYAEATNQAFGGAVANMDGANLTEIKNATFVGNKATGTSCVEGGALYNWKSSKIGDVLADFTNNSVTATTGTASGGALANMWNSTIGKLTGSFIGNSAKGKTLAEGGAIGNKATMEEISASFIDNYAQSETGAARGGAVYTTTDLKFVADNKTNEFTGNYVQVGNGEKQYEAIYVDSNSATLTFGSKNNGSFVMNDYINGKTGYNVVLTGDGTGKFELNNQIKQADVTVENTTLDLANGNIDDTTFNTLNSNANAKYELDVDFANKTSDTITTTNASTGVITITGLNILSNPNPLTMDYKLQILNTQNSDLQLALSEEIKSQLATVGSIELSKTLVNSTAAPIKRVTNWNDLYALWGQYEKTFASLGLATTNTTNDSIGVTVQRTEIGDWEDAGYVNDTLAYVNQNASVFESRKFNFDSADNVYTVKENIGDTAGKLTVNGVVNGDDKSTIDINNKSGFVVNNTGAELTINNVELKNSNGPAVMITSGKAVLNNVDFTSNTTIVSSGVVRGAAIHNKGAVISEISGKFSANSVTSNSGDAFGGALSNNGATVEKITNATFVGNTVKATGWSEGGAIWHSNDSTLGDVEADFANNSVTGENATAQGGAIYVNNSTVGNIVGDFIGNYVKGLNANGGAIFNNASATITSISGLFENNYAEATNQAFGGAVANMDGANLAEIKNATFVGNKATGSSCVEGGALYNWKSSNIGDVSADFMNNSVTATDATASGGALANMWNSTIGKLTGSFVGNSAKGKTLAEGGAIGNKATIGDISANFIGNYAESETGSAKGGAVYTTTNLNFVADNNALQIRDNYTVSNGVKDDNAIYVDNANATFTFNIKNNGSILLKDNIDGATGYKFNVTGDNTGMFYLQNDIRNANVSMGGITLNTINNQVYTNHFNSFTLTDTINMAVDVDLANGTMDRITADTFGDHNGSLNVIGMNLISDMASDVYTKNILFAEGSLKEQVTLSVNNLPDSNFQTTLLTPIYKYNVSYDKSGENGMFVFARPTVGGTGSTGNASDAFNPAILAGSTSAAVGAVGTVNQAVHHSFNNVDAYMNIPYMERMAMKRRNHYALASIPDDVRQLGKYSPLYLPGDEEESVWVKPYTTFESVPLKNGPKVSNISYGTLVGFDSQMQSLRHGWDRVISGYVGYTGASQRYSGVDATQNGGILGGTVTLYKGNFFNATTLNVGSSVSQNETMYGKDDYTMLMSGIANKTGYNLEFKDGKVILQPSMLVGYTFVNTFDYTNAAGVKIDNKPLHAIQLSPSVKLIGNLKHGWQPYASVGMVWNVMAVSDVTANGVKLPEMKVKPYVQYGVGLQKRVKDHFMAYGQAMLHNGGRNGISLTAGFRWAIGHKDNCGYENSEIKSDKKALKVKTNKKAKQIKVKAEKKVLKELSSSQKAKIELEKKKAFKVNRKLVSIKTSLCK